MASAQKTLEEIHAALELGRGDLRFLLTKEKILESFQAYLFEGGITSVRQCGMLASTVEDMREMLKKGLWLGTSGGFNFGARVSCILVAWETAKTRSAEEAKAEAQAVVHHVPKPLATTDFQSMRKAFEARWLPLQDYQTPGRFYLERKMQSVEINEPRAEDFTSADKDDCRV